MAEEEATQLAEEQDKELEPLEKEKPEKESTEEETEETEESEEGLEGVEEFDEEEDYFESLGVGKQTGEQVAEEIKKLRQENDSLKQYRAETGFEKPTPRQTQTSDEHRFIKEASLASKHISTIQFGTDDAGQKAKKSYETMAGIVDSAVDPVIKQSEQGMQTLRGALAKIAEHLIDQSYKGFSRQDLVALGDIKEQMMGDFEFDADRYAKRYLFERKPDLLAELTRKAEKKGEEKGQRKRFPKFTSTRRGKPAPKGIAWESYFTQGKPNEKFHSLSNAKEKLKVAEAYEKAALAAEK